MPSAGFATAPGTTLEVLALNPESMDVVGKEHTAILPDWNVQLTSPGTFPKGQKAA